MSVALLPQSWQSKMLLDIARCSLGQHWPPLLPELLVRNHCWVSGPVHWETCNVRFWSFLLGWTPLGGGWRRQNRDQFSACTLAWCGQYVHTWALCPPIQGMLCSIYLYYKYPLPFVRVEESVCHEREWDLRFNCFVSRFNPPSGFWLHLQSTCRKT